MRLRQVATLSFWARVAMCAIVVIACASAVSAQTLYGTLLGNVTDDTGLAVPGATVKITHVETAQTREVPDKLHRQL